MLNLIDTPGHFDFQFEVEKTLYAAESVLLLIDITKGI
jgi:GTP-binding protein LepA